MCIYIMPHLESFAQDFEIRTTYMYISFQTIICCIMLVQNVASCQPLYDNTSKTRFKTEYHHQWSSTGNSSVIKTPGARALILPYLYFKLKQTRIWFYRVLSSSWKSVSSSSLWNGSRSPFLCILLLMTAQPNAKPSRVPSTKQPTEMPAIVPAMSKEWCSISPVLKRLCRIQFHSAASSVLFVDKSSAVQITIPEKVPSMSPYTWKYIFYIILLLIRVKMLSPFEWYIIYISNNTFVLYLYWRKIFKNSYWQYFRPTYFTNCIELCFCVSNTT